MEFLEERHLLAVFSPGGDGTIGLDSGPLEMMAADTLRIDLGGAATNLYDRVVTTSAANFDGKLAVQLVNGYDPAVGTSFKVVTSSNSAESLGQFSELILPQNMAGGKRLVPVLEADGLTLVVADPERPTGNTQWRLPKNAVTSELTSFLGGVTTSVGFAGMELNVLGQNIQGDFEFGVGLLDGAPVVAATAENVSVSLGGDLVHLSDGAGSFFLMQTGVAGEASVALSVKQGLPVSFEGTFGLAINTTGVDVNGSVNTATVKVPSGAAGPYVRVEGTDVSFTAEGQQVRGDLLLESTTIIENAQPVPIVRGAASGVSATLGSNQGGVQFSNGQGGFVVRPTGVAAEFAGDVALVGISDELQLSGQIGGKVLARMNNTGVAVQQSFTTSNGGEVTLDFSDTGTDTVVEIGGALNLEVANFLSVGGGFAIRSQSADANTPGKLLVGVNLTRAFFGDAGDSGTADDVGVLITGGKLAMVIEPTEAGAPASYALSATTGQFDLVGVDAVELSGMLEVRVNKTGDEVHQTIAVPGADEAFDLTFDSANEIETLGGQLKLNVEDFVTVEGNFGFERTTDVTTDPDSQATITTTTIKVGVSELNAFVGDPVPDRTGLEIHDGKFGLAIFKPSIAGIAFDTTYALTASGSASLVGLEDAGLTLSLSDVTIKKNTTGRIVPATTVSTPGGDVTVEFQDGESAEQVRGQLDLDIAGFVSASGAFGFERDETVVDQDGITNTLRLGVTDLTVFVGDDDTGLSVTGGDLGLVLYKTSSVDPDTQTTTSQTTTYALSASGNADLVGVDELDLTASVAIRKNTTGKTISESVSTPQHEVAVAFEEGEENLESIGGHLELDAGGFVSLEGGFRLTKTVDASASPAVTTSLVIGASVSGFFGQNEGTGEAIGVQVNNASLGLVVLRTTGATDPDKNGSSYALTATSGDVALVGVDDLTLGGSLSVRVNKTGQTIDQSIVVSGEDDPVEVKFASEEDVQTIGGTLHLGISDFVTLSGGFSFEKHVEQLSATKTETTLVVGAAGVSTFLGDRGTRLGFELTEGTLGLELTKTVDSASGAQNVPATYALDARGNVALVGLPLALSGTLGLRYNSTDQAIDKQISVPNPAGGAAISAPIKVAADQPIEFSGTDVTLGIADVFTLGGSFVISRQESDGQLLVDIQQAALSLLVDQREVVSVAGSAQFTLGGADGFKLKEFNVGGFGFDGENAAGGGQSGGSQGNSPEDTPAEEVAEEEKQLGPLTVSGVGIESLDFQLGRPESNGKFPLSITVGIEIDSARIDLGDGALTATATGVTGSFGVNLALAAHAPYVSDVAATGEWSLAADEVTVGIGEFLTLSAHNLAINPQAGANENLVSFGSASAALHAASLIVTGTASNFGITGDRKFAAGENFSIAVSMDSAEPLQFPLPLSIKEAKVTWQGDNFTDDPLNFQLTVSASISGNFGPVAVSGSVDSLVFDIGKARDGAFPIIDLAGFTASAKGDLFGGKINGGIIGGVVKFDSQGDPLPSSATVYADSVFYGGIIAGFEFASASGAEIRVGFSQLGFLSAYLTSNLPEGILLDPVSGLAITDFRGGVEFNADPLTAPETPGDLLDKDDLGFEPTTKLTVEEWKERIIGQVINQKRAATPTIIDIDEAANDIIRIEAGGRLYSQYVSESVLHVDVDIIILTNGQFAVVGKGVVGSGAIEADVKIYGDLRSLGDADSTDPLKMVFAADMNTAEHLSENLNDPLLRIEGEMTLGFFDVDGNLVNPTDRAKFDSFEFRVLGRTTFAPIGFAKVIIGGSAQPSGSNPQPSNSSAGFAEIKLTVVDRPALKRVTLDFSGSISIDGMIKADDLISAAGQLNLENRPSPNGGGSVEIWGAAQLDFDTNSPGLSFLSEAGLAADANFLVGLNFSSGDKVVELALPGRELEQITIAQNTVVFEAQGTLTFNKGIGLDNDKFNVGAYLEFDGVFSFVVGMTETKIGSETVSSLGFELFVAARLSTGLTIAGNDLKILEIDALGLVIVTNIGGDSVPTLAARIDLAISYATPWAEFDLEKAQLLLNTTGKNVEYEVPERLVARLEQLQSRRDKPYDPEFLGAEFSEDVAYITIPGAPTDADGNAMAAGPYVQMVMQGTLTVAKAFELDGAFRITVGAGGFELGIGATAHLALPGAKDLFSAQATGLLRITDQGLVGGFALASSFAIPNIDLAASQSSYIGINTTATAENLSILPVGFDPVLPAYSATVYIDGVLQAGGMQIRGRFALQVSSESIQLMIDAGLDLLSVGRVAVSGKAAIHYGDRPGLELKADLSVSSNLGVPGIFDVGGDLSLEIDSRDQKFQVALKNARVKLLSVIEATGSASILVQDGYFRVEGDFHGSLLSIVTVDFHGFLDSRGNFELFLGGGLKIGTDSWGIQAGGHFHILRDIDADPPVPLAFDADLFGRVLVAGLDLASLHIGVSYASPPAGDGRIQAFAEIKIIVVTIPVRFTLGYLRLDAPELPALAQAYGDANGRTLVLNVGTRGGLRHKDAGRCPESDSQCNKDESYVIDSLGPGTKSGERIRVQAFGATQIFDNITGIEAIDGGSNGGSGFGEGNDQLIIAKNVGTFRPITVRADGGTGSDLFINQSNAAAVFKGGDGDDVLLSNKAGDTLDGGAGNNEMSGVAGTKYSAGDGNNVVTWYTAFGLPDSINLGSGDNKLVVIGTDAAEAFKLDGSTSNGLELTIGQSAFTAKGIKTVQIQGAGGADTLSVHTSGVTAAGVTNVIADLSRVQAKQDGTSTASLRADGAANVVNIYGTANADIFELETDGATDYKVTVKKPVLTTNQVILTVNVWAPTAKTDALNVYGGDGDDTFTLTGAHRAAASRTRVKLFGQDGDDTASLPLVDVPFDGGDGTANKLTYALGSDDGSAFTLTDGRITSSTVSTTYAAVSSLTVNGAEAAGTFTMQSTHIGKTIVNSGANKVTVKGSSGFLDITTTSGLVQIDSTGATAKVKTTSGAVTINTSSAYIDVTTGSGAVMIHDPGAEIDVATTNGPVTINKTGGTIDVTTETGTVTLLAISHDVTVRGVGDGSGGKVVIGTGLLSRISAHVDVTNMGTVVYDDKLDGVGRAFSISDSGVVAPGYWNNATITNVLALELYAGLGDDTVTSTVGKLTQLIRGDVGTNRLDVTLDGKPSSQRSRLPQSFIDSRNFAVVTFTNTGNTNKTTWELNGAHLDEIDPNDNTVLVKLLSVANPELLTITLDDGDDTVKIKGTPGPTNVQLGGGKSDVIIGPGLGSIFDPLTLDARGSNNTLTIDDGNSPPTEDNQLGRELTITKDRILTRSPITYNQAQYELLKVKLGAANDILHVSDLLVRTEINTGDGDDVVTAGGSLNEFFLDMGRGKDIFTLTAGTGTVTFDGGNGPDDDDEQYVEADEFIADRSEATAVLHGSLTMEGQQPVLRLDGLPRVKFAASTVEVFEIKLGRGNDTFDVDSAGFSPEEVLLDGGAGDDVITVYSVGGASGTFTVSGGTGRDTLYAIVTTPTDDQFIPIIPKVERLVIDHTVGDASVAWIAAGHTVGYMDQAEAKTLIDAEGAGYVELLGRGPTAQDPSRDTLTVTGANDVNPLQITLRDNTATVYEGLNVVSQDLPAVGGPSVIRTVEGLSGNLIAVADNGRLVFTDGGYDFRRVAVFRSGGPAVPLTYVHSQVNCDLPGSEDFDLGSATGLVATPDGRTLLRSSLGQLFLYDVDPVTAALTLTQAIPFDPIHGMKLSPDGSLLVLLRDHTVELYSLDNFTADSTLPAPTVISLGSEDARRVTFSDDLQQVYVAGNQAVFVLQRTGGDPSWMLEKTWTDKPGVDFNRYSLLEASDDGTLLFAARRDTDPQSTWWIDVFRLGSPEPDDPELKKIAQLSVYNLDVHGSTQSRFPNDLRVSQLKYDSASQTLVVRGNVVSTNPGTYPIFFRYDSENESFTQINPGASFLFGAASVFHGFDVATVDGTSYAAFAVPFSESSAHGWTGLAWYDLSSATPEVPLGIRVGDQRSLDEQVIYTNAAVLADEAGIARILGVRAVVENADFDPYYLPWVRNEYAIYAPTATDQSDALATLALDGRYVQSLAAYRNADGVQNVWWAIENEIVVGDFEQYIGSDYKLKSYEYANGVISERQSFDFSGPGKISFSPDGSVAYIETSSGRLRYAVGSEGEIGDLLRIDPVKVGYTVTSDYSYSAPQDADGIDRLPVGAADDSELTTFRDGFGALYINAPDAIAVSADKSTIYLAGRAADGRGGVFSLRVVDGLNQTDFFDLNTANFTDVIRLENRLYVLNGAIFDVSLGATTGLPSSVRAGLASSFQAALDNSNLITLGGGRLSLYDISNGLKFQNNSNNAIVEQSIAEGQAEKRTLSGVNVSGSSSDGRFLYGYSTVDKALGVYDRVTQLWSTFFDSVQVPRGALDGVPAIVTSQLGTDYYALVVNPASGAYTVFKTSTTDSSSLTTPVRHESRSYLIGARSLAYVSGELYVATANAISKYALPAELGALPGLAAANLPVTNATKVQVIGGRAYIIGDNGTSVTSIASSLAGAALTVTGLAGVTDVAAVGDMVYAVSSEGRVYQLLKTDSALTLARTYTNGDGVVGIRGALAVTVSPDGSYLFVAGTADNAVVVFRRDPVSGRLTFVQAARDGRAASGINQPVGLFAPSDGKLVVASAAGRLGAAGGFAILTIAPLATAEPFAVQTTFHDIVQLTLEGSNDTDTIRLISAPELVAGAPVDLIVNAGNGDDAITVLDGGPRGTKLTINAGAGNDLVTVQQSIDRSNENGTAISLLTITPDAGADQVFLQNLAPNTETKIYVDDGDVDVVRVRGQGVPQSSLVKVNGDLATGPAFPGDGLIYDGEGAGFSDTNATMSTIQLDNFGDVEFNNLYKANPQQVFLISAPRPTLSGATISEGQSVTLTASDLSHQANVSYEWDLDGDGDFSDATDGTITLDWQQLRALGINDGARSPAAATAYPIAVRATTTQNAVQFGGQIYQLFADASALLLVTDTSPTLAAIPGAATLGKSYTVPLFATDPGDDRVKTWTVNWGDGTSAETVGADATSASHVYAKAGDFTVTVTAIDEDGSTITSGVVQVGPGAGSVAVGAYSATIAEGDGFTASVSYVGTPSGFKWTFSDGTATYDVDEDDIDEAGTIALTWAQLDRLGVRDNGVFSLRVTATYNNESIPAKTDPPTYTATSEWVFFTVVNTPPNGTLELSLTSVTEGSSAGAVTVKLTGYTDPSPQDTPEQASLDVFFDVSLTADLSTLQPDWTQHPVDGPEIEIPTEIEIPSQVLSTPGLKTVRAVLRDKDGGRRELFATFVVTPLPPVAPTLSVSLTSSTIDEGSTASLTAIADHPLGVTVNSWRIHWGDGQVDEIAGDVTQPFTHPYTGGAVAGSTYDILVTAFTSRGEVSTSSSITVNDVAPTVTLAAASPAPIEGALEPFTVNLKITDPGDDTVTSLVIDWGDGASETLPGDATSATHTYRDVPQSGTFNVRVTRLTDNEGDFIDPSYPLAVTVANAGPVLPTGELTGGAFYTVEFTRPIYTIAQYVNVQLSVENSNTLDVVFGAPIDRLPVSSVVLVIGPDGVTELPIAAAPVNADADGKADTWRLTFQSKLPKGDYTIALADLSRGATQVSAVGQNASTLDLVFDGPVASLSLAAIKRVVGSSGAIFNTMSLRPVAPDSRGASNTWRLALSNPISIPVAGVEGSPLDFSAMAASVATGLEPLTFTWVVTNGGSEVYRTSTTPSPVSINSLSASFVEDEDNIVRLVAATVDALGAPLTTTWTITPASGVTPPLTGAEVVIEAVADSYAVSVTTTSANGTATATGVLTIGPQANLSSVAAADGLSLSSELVDASTSSVKLSVAGDDIWNATDITWTITRKLQNTPSGDVTTLTGAESTFIPAEDGTYDVSVTVTLGNETLTATAVLTVGVQPKWSALSGIGANVLGGLTSPGYEFVSSSQASFTPQDDGLYTVTLIVSDGEGDTATYSQNITVANREPVIETFLVDATGTEGAPVTFSATASDVGVQDVLSYKWTVLNRATGATVATLTGATVEYTPYGGEFLVRLDVSDGDGGTATRFAPLSVANAPPTIKAGTLHVDTTGVEGAAATFSVEGQDNGGDSGLSYRWQIISPSGQLVLINDRVASYIWPDNGSYKVSVTITDRAGASVTAGPVTVAVANLPPEITFASVPSTGTEGEAISFSAVATDPAGTRDAINYRWTITGPDNFKIVRGGPNPSFTPPDNGLYDVRLTVFDDDGGETTRDFEINVANADPVVGAIVVSGTLSEGQTVGLSVPPASDAAADLESKEFPIKYLWTIETPAGVVLLPDEGRQINLRLDDSGVYTVTLQVIDKDEGVSVRTTTFSVDNVAPNIVSLTVPPRGYVGFDIPLSASATDVLGDLAIRSDETPGLHYDWTITGPNGIETPPRGNSTSFKPTVAGDYMVSLKVSDKDGGVSTRTGAFTVLASTMSIRSFNIPAGATKASLTQLYASATDALGAPVTLTWTITPPAGKGDAITLPVPGQSGQNVSFTPLRSGVYHVLLTATSVNGTATIEGELPVANVLASVTSISVPSSKFVGVTTNLSASATYPTSESLSYQWTIYPPVGSPEILSGAQTQFTPKYLGTYEVRLTVVDTDGGQTIVKRFVNAIAPVPTITEISAPRLEGTAVVVKGIVAAAANPAAPDGVALTWTAFKNGGVYATGTGAQWSFTPNDNGQYRIVLTASVAGVISRSTEQTITVGNVAPTPTLVSISEMRREGTAIFVNGLATDPGTAVANDGVKLAWSVFKDGASSVFASGSGADWSFVPDDNGGYRIVLTATDKDNASTSVEQTIAVSNVAPTPTIVSISQPRQEGTTVLVSGAATDPGFAVPNDGLSLAWTVYKNSGSTAYASGAGAGWSFLPNDNGSYRIVLTATDKDNASTSAEQTITVTNVAPTPAIVSISEVRKEGTTIFVSGEATDPGFAVPNDGLSLAWTVYKNFASTAYASGAGAGWSFVPDDNGSYRIVLTATDKDLDSTSVEQTVSVINVAPTPAIVSVSELRKEGTSISVSGSATDPGSAVLNDGVNLSWTVFKNGANTAYASGSSADWSFVPNDNGSYRIVLTATDKDNDSTSVEQTITVGNVAPVIGALTSTSSTLANRSSNGVVTISGSFSDPGLLDTHSALVNWGDGTSATFISVNQSADTFAGQHQYATGGVFTISVTVIDNDNASSLVRTTTAFVEGVGLVDGVLYVIGTDGKDDVDIKLAGGSQGTRLDIDAKLPKGGGNAHYRLEYDAKDIDRIVMYLAGGDDKAKILKDVMIDAWIYGGDGNDKLDGGGGNDFLFGESGDDDLSGGRGSDVVVGGDGDDKLRGGSDGGLDSELDGRDILIGGRGADDLKADKGDDLLIGGYTAFDNDTGLLELLSREWTSARDYATRVSNIRSGTGEYLSASSVRLKASGDDRTVFDDGTKDKLNGGSGRDWFFAMLSGDNKTTDKISGEKGDELIDLIW